MGATYSCEKVHLLRHRSEHTCASTIYYGMNAQLKASQCNTTHLIDHETESTILGAVEQLLL